MENNNQKSIKELLEFSILNIDKSSGPTSFDISDFVRNKLQWLEIRKTSHFGTLDPKVTGVLPIALNRACKLTGFFLGHDKEYIGIMHCHQDISIEKLQEIIDKRFTGKIKQTPPVKSRVKRQEREREIMEFRILEQGEKDCEKDFLFRAKVQGGTYIRKLIDDLGKEIGGAHMLELRRIRAGIFSESDKEFVSLYDFEKAVDKCKIGNYEDLKKILTPAEEAIKKIFSVVQVKESAISNLLTGKPLFKKDCEEVKLNENNLFALFYKERFIGIYKKINDKQILAKPEFVLQPMK